MPKDVATTDAFSAYGLHLTIDEVAEVLGIEIKTAYKLVTSGTIPSYRVGSRWLILREEVREYAGSPIP